MPRLSVRQIETNLIGYFTRTFPHDVGTIFPGTNVRNRYRYSNEAWGDLADELSREGWMIGISVVLIQNDMRSLSTIAQLAQKIASLQPVAATRTGATITPMSTGASSSDHLETTSSPKPAAKKVSKKKKTAKKISKKKSRKKAKTRPKKRAKKNPKKNTRKRARKNS